MIIDTYLSNNGNMARMGPLNIILPRRWRNWVGGIQNFKTLMSVYMSLPLPPFLSKDELEQYPHIMFSCLPLGP